MNRLGYQAICTALLSLLVQTVSSAQQPDNASNPQLGQWQSDSKPKISPEEARRIALANAKGEIIHEKLDKFAEKTCYSFDIKDSGDLKEVLVDGTTGQVVIIEKGPTPQRAPHLNIPSIRPH